VRVSEGIFQIEIKEGFLWRKPGCGTIFERTFPKRIIGTPIIQQSNRNGGSEGTYSKIISWGKFCKLHTLEAPTPPVFF
jgi:homoaconitase/3-isopropylmalate dehydratase large subunit